LETKYFSTYSISYTDMINITHTMS
jgi:hypothetical protein